jgi:hypothetical protein
MKNLLPQAIAITLIGFSCLTLEALMSPQAMALSFNFSFNNNSNGGGPGFVTGIVEGLSDNTTSAATSVQVLSNTAGFGIGEYVTDGPAIGGYVIPNSNVWTVSRGVIQSIDFLSFGGLNRFPAVTDSALRLSTVYGAGMTNYPYVVVSGSNTGLVFTPVETTPIPAPSFVFGLLGLGLGMCRKREGSVVAQDGITFQ